MTPPAQSETRLSSLSLRILSVIDDDGWHDQEDVIEAVQYTIPPGEAFRLGQAASNAVVDRRDTEDIIASGRRARTVTMINNLLANNRIERRGGKSRNAKKEIRVIRRAPQVYLVRDATGALNVYTYGAHEVAIHVIDAWADSDNPEADAAEVQKILNAIPLRMERREEVQEVCRHLVNRHNVAATMRSLMERPLPTDSATPGDAPEHGGY